MLRAKSIKEGWIDSDLFEQMIFKNNNYIIDYNLNNDFDREFSISHHVNFTFKGNQSVLFDGKKGERVYRELALNMPKHGLV